MTTSTSPTDAPARAAGARRRGPLRRLYDWVLHWAETPYGTPALTTLSFAESSFFPIPPDVLLVALCLGDRSRAFRFALWCSIGSVLGGIAGYGIGAFMWEVLQQFFYDWVPGFTPELFVRVQGYYERWDFWIVFVAAFTPIPFKVITITAGAFGINFPMFVVASTIGRAARFYLVAGLLYFFGAPVQRILDRYLGWITLGLAALAIAGFAALKYLVP